MNYQGTFAVLLVVCLTAGVRADTAGCASAIGSCTVSKASSLLATDCAGKKPFFDCIKEGGCTTSMSTYQSTVTARGYQDCGAASIAMGFSLPILMFTLAKFFSQ